MAKKPEHALFEHQPHRKAIIVDGGIYKEVDCYRRGLKDEQYVYYKGGFIKLLGKTMPGNTFGTTSHPKIRWVEVVETPNHF